MQLVRFFMHFFFFCLCLLITQFFLIDTHTDSEPNYTVVMKDGIVFHEAIENIIPETFSCTNIFFSADTGIDREELRYLLSLEEHKEISRDKLVDGIKHCVKKNQFSTISLAFEQEKQEITLHLLFTSELLIKQIKIIGIWYDTATYHRLYGIQKYERFDTQKHNAGMHAIKKYLHAIGYCAADVKDHLHIHQKEKFVTVTLTITFKKKCIIDTVSIIAQREFENHRMQFKAFEEVYCKPTLATKPYSHVLINTTLKNLAHAIRHEGFLFNQIRAIESIDTEHARVSIKIIITPSYPYKITFRGNNYFSSDALYDHLATTLKNDHKITTTIIQEELITLYQDNGFLDIEVTSTLQDNQIFFTIEEHKRSVITEIFCSFQGSEQLHKTKYEHLLKQHLVQSTLKKKKIDHATAQCISALVSDGFLTARFIGYRVERKTNQSVTLHISFEHGNQATVDKIEIQSSSEVAALTNLSLPQKNIPITTQLLSEQKERILQTLRSAGYVHATVSPEIDAAYRTKTLLWNVHPGIQTSFGKLIVVGPPTVSFKKILKTINYQTGAVWRQSFLQEAAHNLQRIPIFEQIELYPDIEHIGEEKPVLLHLIPDDTFEARLRFGTELQHVQDYQSLDGVTYKLGFSFIIKNKLHLADIAQVDADFTGAHREIIVSYNIPLSTKMVPILPLSSLWKVKMQGYFIRFDNPGAIGYTKNIYTMGKDGFLVNIANHKDSSYLTISSGFEAQKTSIKDQKNAFELAKALNFDQSELSKLLPYFFVDINVLFDFLDDKLYPSRGISSLCGIKAMIPLHDKTKYFTKLMYEQLFFFTFFRFTFGLRARFGYIFHKDFSKISPTERFYLGGSHSVRGYEADLFPPLSPFVDDTGKKTVVPRGGKIMTNINIEVKRTIGQYIGITVFHDIGALADNIEQVNAMLPLHTTGFGLYFITPFGPLRFDIGWKWKKIIKEERNYAWYLSFGRAF